MKCTHHTITFWQDNNNQYVLISVMLPRFDVNVREARRRRAFYIADLLAPRVICEDKRPTAVGDRHRTLHRTSEL